MNVLWHGPDAVGVCVFASPAATVALRSRVFGLAGAGRGPALAALNEQLWLLQRVVLHPTYRGAGVAARFVRRCCELCPVRWVETLSAMGQVNPFFERAGFTRIGVVRKPRPGNGPWRFSEPVYYLFENR